jgi:hypothetical protein
MGVNFVKSDTLFNPKNFEVDEEDKSPFFSTTKKFKRRNQSQEPETSQQRGAAIPPPATFEYFGPSTSKHPRQQHQTPANLEASITAGLKFLREQVDKGNKNKWTASNEYTDNS